MKTISKSLLFLLLLSFVIPAASIAQESTENGNVEAADDTAEQAASNAVPSQENAAGDRAEAEESAIADETELQTPANQPLPAQVARPAAVREATIGVGQKTDLDEQNIRFSFSRTDWKSVLEWFSEEAEMSLEYDKLPQGSFTYSDPNRAYTVSESLDVINLGLMKKGFALVRRGRKLDVIDLEADNADKLISELAELVRPEELDERGKSDIVSCVFALGSMTPEAAKEELPQMVGPWGRVIVLDTARQVKVTETAEKLKAIRTLLTSASLADSQVVELELEHRGADELLELARPLLGLEPGENVSDEIRISVSVYGDLILATGSPGKLALLESIIAKRDKPLPEVDPGGAGELALPVFQTHFVRSADIATVFDVLQTMLADYVDARIGIDPSTKAIIVRARPEVQELVSKTIAQMEGTGQDFKVIQLKRFDPAQALLTINKFFGITEEGGDGPIVDGDPLTGRLWVRGTSEEIALVEKLIQELEGEDALSGLGDKVRLLPYTGRAAEDALEQVQNLWPVTGRSNAIRTRTPSRGSGSGDGGIPERRRAPEKEETEDRPVENRPPRPTTEAGVNRASQYQFVSDRDQADPKSERFVQTEAKPGVTVNVDGADIVVQFTPSGILVASEDVEALNAFQSLLESVASPSAMQSDLPTIFWLKYCEADVTAELISTILGGTESTMSSAVDSVTGGGFSGMLGLLGGGGGGGGSNSSAKSILTATGSVSIVPDMRLNALIVQANEVDLTMIELLLEKIDRQESPEDVETTAKPALIPVIYQDAAQVAKVVKEIFGDRIAGAASSSGGRGGGGGGGGQPSPQDFIAALRGGGGGGRGGGGAAKASEPAKISVSVDAKSNSLVVIATPQDFEEVRALVDALDYGGMENEDVIETVVIGGTMNAEAMRTALEAILGTQVKTTADSSPASSTASSTSGGNDAASAADIQRRTEFINRLRSGGFGGGFGGRGGAPGGGGGTPGGGFGGFGGRGGGGPGGGGGRGGGR